MVSNPWRVAVSGLSQAGLYHLERLSLSSEIKLVGAFDADPERRHRADGLGFSISHEGNGSEQFATDADVVFLIDDPSVESITAAIVGGQHVVIHRPWLLSSIVLNELHLLAERHSRAVTIASLRRWSSDFLTVLEAQTTGRIGKLNSVRLTSCEKRIPNDDSANDVLREFGYHWLDQLLIMTKSNPCSVFAKRRNELDSLTDTGFLAILDFIGGCTAQIDIDTKSRLGHRTGWMLEGDLGSYRSDRLYTETPDGEIVDEPIHRKSDPSADPFITELVAAWRGEKTMLPTLADAARVMQLIEAIEQSAQCGKVVQV